MLVHWIWLSVRSGLSDRDKISLLEHFRDPEDIYYAGGKQWAEVEGISEEGLESLVDKNLLPSEEILAKCMEKGIHICTYHDAAYPGRLKNISDPPPVLYYKGRLPDFDGNPVIAVVGTRHASAYGLGVAKRMGYQIARCGGIVVSGLAYGIDGVSMSGCLTAGGCAVGVLDCGADVVYPVSNRGLFADTEKNGCLLSEFPPGTPPYKWNFPKRNRIISGLSCGVLVVEAPEVSGSLITARRAADQGRDVFVVPGNIDVPSFMGSNALLREGAIAVSSGWDVVSEYTALFPDKIRKDLTPVRMAGYADEVAAVERENSTSETKVAQKTRTPGKKRGSDKKKEKITIDNGAKPPYSDGVDPWADLSEEERAVVSLLEAGERLVDDVIAETALPAGKVLAVLTLLEVKGIAARLPGKRVSLKK